MPVGVFFSIRSSANSMASPLISALDLARLVGDPSHLIVDCRFDLGRPAAGEAVYRTAHIPGAVYAHLDRDLCAPITAETGRHPLPTPERFAATLSAWGVTPHMRVIAYDADNSAYAARLWWMLRWVGHREVAVLNGGFKAWLAANLSVTSEVPIRTAARFQANPDRQAWLTSDEVAARVREHDWRLLDARAVERYAGEVEPIDAIGGHVPGARSHPFATNLDASACFLPPQVLHAQLTAAQDGIADDHTILMCGSGVTACHNLFALEIAGKFGAKLYAGSWSEWIREPRRGIAKGRQAQRG
jgi:thiosulfate/3-mercaptopyruvate sulfurtransferase